MRLSGLPSLPFGAAAVCVAMLCVATACASAQSRVRAADASAFPLRLCLSPDAATRAGLSRGDVGLEVALRHRVPQLRYTPAFRVFAVQANGVRQEIHAFGMQPDIVERGRPVTQRFAVDLRGHALTPDARGRICFEIERADGSPGEAAPPAMDVSIGWRSSRVP
ncbi:hypothetical protein [Lysobacter hankyongensis]|uniref:DUF4426 domain-containing protein n=1 Tax=Lysobacter hankyongensis TaxID=1176535 RepID=A0ABP9C1G3_9GAMM